VIGLVLYTVYRCMYARTHTHTHTLTYTQVSTLVPSLIEASKFAPSLQVRSLALECLMYLPNLVPFHKMFPFRAEVTRALGTAIADHKRCVRLRAANCRNVWYMLTS
jgi:DNA repair/transcription protein MET18/MMS19